MGTSQPRSSLGKAAYRGHIFSMVKTPEPQKTGTEGTDGDSAKPENGGASTAGAKAVPPRPTEIGGPPGPEPTRYGDWQFNGRVTDF